MAVAVTNVQIAWDNQVRGRFATITMDSSYATSGEALTASDFGLYNILAVIQSGGNGGSVSYDATNKKLLVYGTNTTTQTTTSFATVGLNQIPNATDLSTVVIQALVIGN